MKKGIAWLIALTLLASCLPAMAAGATARTALDDPFSARAENIQRAAWSLNQTVVAPEGTFSFNSIVGPRTAERGYLPALNGRGAEVVGGGVGQAASTLYIALLGLDPGTVEFGALSVYGDRFNQSYVPDGGLAILVDYSAGTDFCFTNLTSAELIIEMWISGGNLCCSVSLGEIEAPAEAAADAFLWNPNFMSANTQPPAARSTLLASAEIHCGSDPAVLANVALAADSICDTTLLTGDVFSFNTIVGPREEAYGYVPATNGRGVTVTGGGVAQVASVLWLAVKNLPDVSITQKSTYGQKYNQSYVASSADAILTSYPSTDFAFRNNRAPITLYTRLEGETLRCEVYG